MQQLIYFIQKYKYFLFFLLLEFIALYITINNNNFHKSKFISSANFLTGGFYKKATQFSTYFELKKHNDELRDENIKLKNKLEFLNSKKSIYNDSTVIDSTEFNQKFTFTTSLIVKNNYHLKTNFLTIDKGTNQGVTKEMAVVNSLGIIGVIDASSNNYSRIQSILNTNSKINARLKNSAHFGTLIWDGKSNEKVQLIDIPRQAAIKIGDTIITGGKSTIFPEGILIGSVINISNTNSLSTIDIQLFNDMTSLSTVYIIKSLDKAEVELLNENLNE